MKNNHFTLCLLIFSVLTSCSSSSKKIKTEDYAKDRVFPNGLYRHEVELSVPQADHSTPKNFRFLGLVRIDPDKIQAIALSAMGITVFKIVDDLKTGIVQNEIYIEQMKKYEPKLLEYYSTLRAMLTMKTDQAPLDGQSLPIETKNGKAFISFLKYDSHRIPEEASINSETFNVSVKVTGYEI